MDPNNIIKPDSQPSSDAPNSIPSSINPPASQQQPAPAPVAPGSQPTIKPFTDEKESPFPSFTNQTQRILLGIIAALTVISIVLIAVVVSSGSDGTPSANNSEGQSNHPDPSSAPARIEIESINDALSRDVSRLNNEQDFPEDRFSDKNIGL